MKRMLSLLLAILTILSLSACDSSDDENTTSASAQKAETVALDTNSSETETSEVAATESSASETEAPTEIAQEANIEMYAPAIESAIADSLYSCDGSGFLYDIDEDGVDELVMLSLYSIYVEEAGFEIDEYAYSIYDIENGEVIAKLERELLIADVGGTLGDISVVSYQGSTAISVRRSRSATTEQGEWNWESEYTILDPQTLQPITTIVTDSSDETDAIEPIITAELFYNDDSDGSMSLEALLRYVQSASDATEASILSLELGLSADSVQAIVDYFIPYFLMLPDTYVSSDGSTANQKACLIVEFEEGKPCLVAHYWVPNAYDPGVFCEAWIIYGLENGEVVELFSDENYAPTRRDIQMIYSDTHGFALWEEQTGGYYIEVLHYPNDVADTAVYASHSYVPFPEDSSTLRVYNTAGEYKDLFY